MRNVHERTVHAPLADVATLLTTVGSPDDRLWPADRWPPMVLDRGLAVGSRGGHAFVRYRVVAVDPGRSVTFEFEPSVRVRGTHSFTVEPVEPLDSRDLGTVHGAPDPDLGTVHGKPDPDLGTVHGAPDPDLGTVPGVRLTHVIEGRPVGIMRLGWPLVVQPLHDALLEDLLDGAEATLAGRPVSRTAPSRRVRTLRRVAELASRRLTAPSPAQRRAAHVAAAALGTIGGLHALWAVGVPWPASSPTALAQAVAGTPAFPSTGATLTVAGLLGAAAVVLESRVGHGPLPFPVADLGARVVTGVLAVRGVAGFATAALGTNVLGLRAPTPPFRTLDVLVYSPLCLALAWAAHRTWADAGRRPVAPAVRPVDRPEVRAAS